MCKKFISKTKLRFMLAVCLAMSIPISMYAETQKAVYLYTQQEIPFQKHQFQNINILYENPEKIPIIEQTIMMLPADVREAYQGNEIIITSHPINCFLYTLEDGSTELSSNIFFGPNPGMYGQWETNSKRIVLLDSFDDYMTQVILLHEFGHFNDELKNLPPVSEEEIKAVAELTAKHSPLQNPDHVLSQSECKAEQFMQKILNWN